MKRGFLNKTVTEKKKEKWLDSFLPKGNAVRNQSKDVVSVPLMKRGFLNENVTEKKKLMINKYNDVISGQDLTLLPQDVVDSVTKLLDLDQLIRFSFVSRSWNKLSSLPLRGNPWLIVPLNHSTSKDDHTCDAALGFFNPFSGKVYNLALPRIKDRRICGSCLGGWLITVHNQGEIQILHPFSKAVITLPLLSKLPGLGGVRVEQVEKHFEVVAYFTILGDHVKEIPATIIRDAYIYKAVMSSSNPKASVVMSIQGFPKKLVFCRIGEKEKWTLVKGDENAELSDVTFYRGQFFTIGNSGGVFVVEGLDTPSPGIKFVIDSPCHPIASTKYYLVEFTGELLCVMRFRFKSMQDPESPIHMTNRFKVSKLDFNGPKWIDVNSLGKDHALFIGFNQSFSFTTSGCEGFKGNSIFFGDDDYTENHKGVPFGGYDIGVFDMTSGIVEKCYPNVATPIMPPPIWFTTRTG